MTIIYILLMISFIWLWQRFDWLFYLSIELLQVVCKDLHRIYQLALPIITQFLNQTVASLKNPNRNSQSIKVPSMFSSNQDRTAIDEQPLHQMHSVFCQVFSGDSQLAQAETDRLRLLFHALGVASEYPQRIEAHEEPSRGSWQLLKLGLSAFRLIFDRVLVQFGFVLQRTSVLTAQQKQRRLLKESRAALLRLLAHMDALSQQQQCKVLADNELESVQYIGLEHLEPGSVQAEEVGDDMDDVSTTCESFSPMTGSFTSMVDSPPASPSPTAASILLGGRCSAPEKAQCLQTNSLNRSHSTPLSSLATLRHSFLGLNPDAYRTTSAIE